MEDGLTVEWDNVPIDTLSTPDQGYWSVHTYTVQATSELTRLRFIGNVGGGQGTLLDTVSLVGGSDEEAPVVSCPPAITVRVGSVPPAATSVADFTAQGGSIADNQDPDLFSRQLGCSFRLLPRVGDSHLYRHRCLRERLAMSAVDYGPEPICH